MLRCPKCLVWTGWISKGYLWTYVTLQYNLVSANHHLHIVLYHFWLESNIKQKIKSTYLTWLISCKLWNILDHIQLFYHFCHKQIRPIKSFDIDFIFHGAGTNTAVHSIASCYKNIIQYISWYQKYCQADRLIYMDLSINNFTNMFSLQIWKTIVCMIRVHVISIKYTPMY